MHRENPFSVTNEDDFLGTHKFDPERGREEEERREALRIFEERRNQFEADARYLFFGAYTGLTEAGARCREYREGKPPLICEYESDAGNVHISIDKPESFNLGVMGTRPIFSEKLWHNISFPLIGDCLARRDNIQFRKHDQVTRETKEVLIRAQVL